MSPVFAYVDPGSGSAGYQVILGIVLGAGFAMRRVWSALRARFFLHQTPIEARREPRHTAVR